MKKAKIFNLILLGPVAQYVVLLEEVDGTRLVPIWVGPAEGNAIALGLEGEKTPRPMTHDLMKNIFDTIGAKLQKIIISDLKDDSYYAIIELKLDEKTYEIDARPSDSMALAIRTKTPIFIDEKVLEKCPVIMKPISDDEVEKFKEQLKNIKPEDFFKKLNNPPQQNP